MPKVITETARHKQSQKDQDDLRLSRVEVGEAVTITKVDDRGNVVKRTPLKFVVGEKCSHNVNGGQWVCATHGVTFTNQFCKDSHIHAGNHKLAWFCFECNNVQVP